MVLLILPESARPLLGDRGAVVRISELQHLTTADETFSRLHKARKAQTVLVRPNGNLFRSGKVL